MKSCPKCKSNMIIDIVYGYPSEEMSDAVDSNKISWKLLKDSSFYLNCIKNMFFVSY